MITCLNKVRNNGDSMEIIRTVFDDDDELSLRLNDIKEVIDYIDDKERVFVDDKERVFVGQQLLEIERYLKTNCKKNSKYYDGAPVLTWWPNMSLDAIIAALQLIAIVKVMKDEIQVYKRAVDKYLTNEQKISVRNELLEILTQE